MENLSRVITTKLREVRAKTHSKKVSMENQKSWMNPIYCYDINLKRSIPGEEDDSFTYIRLKKAKDMSSSTSHSSSY